MKPRVHLFAATLLTSLLVGATVSQATVIDLYGSDNANWLAGSAANGYARAQVFKPSTATPNPLTSGTFEIVSMFAGLGAATETASVKLELYTWAGSPAATLATTAIASGAVLPLVPGAGKTEIRLPLPSPQSAAGTYFAVLWLSNINQSPNGMNIYGIGSNSNNGNNNDAWNYSASGWGSAKTDREYSIRLDTVPEPTIAALFVVGGLVMLRRRR